MLFGLDTSCAGDHIGLYRTALGTAVAQAMVNILKTDTTHFPVEYRPVSEILGLIGDKWTVLVVAHLAQGKMRFSQLQRDVGGISRKMLAATLRGLERDGFISRTLFPVVPVRVEYELTELGRLLLEPLRELGEFARRHQPQMQAARQKFDEEIGQEIQPQRFDTPDAA